MHLTSKGSQGLFQQAIIQSDPLTIVCSSKEDALALGDRCVLRPSFVFGRTSDGPDAVHLCAPVQVPGGARLRHQRH